MMSLKDQLTRFAGRTDVLLVAFGCSVAISSCAGDDSNSKGLWTGSIDTLPNGTVEVHNPSVGIWDSTTAWHVEEEVRIGTLEGSGPDLFGNISAIEVDQSGNIYVFEAQAQELRVFNASGQFLRTIGREGGGPGEFRQGIGLAWAPDGLLWVVDPGNSRISIFDTTGTYVTMKRILGGYVMMPWPGCFDRAGSFYHYGLDIEAERGGRFVMVRFDTLLNPLDTIRVPRPPENTYFELRSETGSVTAGIPFTASITSRVGPDGHLWVANTGNYHIYKQSVEGDTSLTISREFEPLPVSAEEIDSAVARLEWFTRQGGRIDRSRFPSVKPAIQSLYLDEDGRVWVEPVAASDDSGSSIDVFERDGRYLGRLQLPFLLRSIPRFRHGNIYAVTVDDFGVPYVVRGRIDKP